MMSADPSGLGSAAAPRRASCCSSASAGRAAARPVPRPAPLSLDEALELAIPASDAVGLARADVTRAEGEVKRVRADLLPQLTGTAILHQDAQVPVQHRRQQGRQHRDQLLQPVHRRSVPARSRERVDSLEQRAVPLRPQSVAGLFSSLPFGRKNQYNFGLSFSQTLFSSGHPQGPASRPRWPGEVARIGVTTAEAQARLDVTSTYFDAVLSDRLVAIAELSLAQAETTLAQTGLGKRGRHPVGVRAAAARGHP